MIIFLGLGNNEAKYLSTKHNVGRIVIEKLAAIWNCTFSQQKNYFWVNSGKVIEGHSLILLYSAGFMNNSGDILASFLSYYKPPLSDLQVVVLQDDSDQIIGHQKLLLAGGSAGHHGIGSIYKQLPSLKDQIWRLKIGIRPPGNKLRSETFVLQNLSLEEKNNLEKLSQTIEQNLNLVSQKNLGKFQTVINSLKFDA